MSDHYLETEQAAVYLGVHKKSIPRWTREGTFPDHDVCDCCGRRNGWFMASLDQWRKDTGRDPS